MPSARIPLTERLNIETLDRNLFRGYAPSDGRPWVFGGLVAAQALVAALRTVKDGHLAHSLHGYFMRKGEPGRGIIYKVERIRDGGSFTTRHVMAIQDGEAIFTMTASFKSDEPGLEHQLPMPDVPPPESVPSQDELLAKHAGEKPIYALYQNFDRPIMVHDLNFVDPADPSVREGPRCVWWKSRETLPDDPAIHQCTLAYASDLTLAEASLHRHGRTWLDPNMIVVSIDHSIWFHRPFRADEWLLYVTESPTASAGRGMNFGRLYTQDGRMVATVAQENLMRQRRKMP